MERFDPNSRFQLRVGGRTGGRTGGMPGTLAGTTTTVVVATGVAVSTRLTAADAATEATNAIAARLNLTMVLLDMSNFQAEDTGVSTDDAARVNGPTAKFQPSLVRRAGIERADPAF